MSDDAMNAAPLAGVSKGCCVLLRGEEIQYAGPIKLAPSTAGMMVLLHPDDFASLKNHVDKGNH